MKPPLVLSTLIGGLVVVGAAAVGTTYLGRHPARPAPRPVAQSAPPPQLSAPPSVEEPPAPSPERPRPVRVRSHRRLCPVPAVYHSHRSRPIRRLHIAEVQPDYARPPIYAPPPVSAGWYGHPYGRAEWRGRGWRGLGWRRPGWRYPPRWAYGLPPGYGPGWRDW